MSRQSIFSAAERMRRVDAARASMEEQELDALVFFSGGEIPGYAGDVCYLTGYLPIFEHAWCVLTAERIDLVLPRWEWEHTDGHTWLDPEQVHRDMQRVSVSQGGADICRRLLAGRKRIGLCGLETMPVWLARAIGALGGDDRLVPTDVLKPVRRIKSAEEVEAIRAAAKAVDAGTLAFYDAVGRGGVNEIEIAAEVEAAMRAAGVQRFAIPIVVGSGPNSLDVAVQPRDRVAEPGEMVLLDCAARLDGYVADLARGAVSGGEPDERQRDLIAVTEEMYLAGLERLRPGVDIREPHRVAVQIAAERGFEYLHETGHGVGCDPHEPPWIDESDAEEVFEENMVVAIEPGLYYEGIGGCRIENTILITADNPVELNKVPLVAS